MTFQQYGFLPLADVILTTEHKQYDTFQEYYNLIKEEYQENSGVLKSEDELNKIPKNIGAQTIYHTYTLTVTLNAGVKRAGESGIWEAVDVNVPQNSVYAKGGLYFTPIRT